jgi:hypothetical protein
MALNWFGNAFLRSLSPSQAEILMASFQQWGVGQSVSIMQRVAEKNDSQHSDTSEGKIVELENIEEENQAIVVCDSFFEKENGERGRTRQTHCQVKKKSILFFFLKFFHTG